MMSKPFPATEGELAAHWSTLKSDINRLTEPDVPDLIVKAAAIGNQFVAGFSGSSVRRAQRLRGGNMPVTRFASVSESWTAWLGYREVWSYLDFKSNKRRFCFSSCDLTLFLEYADTADFRQVLRAEWAGPQIDEALEWDFRPNNAGHPHWQVDVAEMLKQDAELEAARALLTDTAPREFGAEELQRAAQPCWYHMGRMHFASGMRPWQDVSIAHQPSKLAEVRDWTSATISLLKIEVGRL